MPPRPFSRSSHAVAQSRRARASHESHRRHQGHGRRRSGRAAINAPCRREIRLLGCASQTRARRCCRWCPDVARSSASRSRRLRHPDEPSGRPTLGGSPTARFSAFRADTHCARKSLAAAKPIRLRQSVARDLRVCRLRTVERTQAGLQNGQPASVAYQEGSLVTIRRGHMVSESSGGRPAWRR